MTTLYLEKGKFNNLQKLLPGPFHELYSTDQPLIPRRYWATVVIAFMLLSVGAIFFIEQAKLKRSEAHYQSLLDQREKVTQSVQGNLTEVTKERDAALVYINSLQNKLTESTTVRSPDRLYDFPQIGRLGLNP